MLPDSCITLPLYYVYWSLCHCQGDRKGRLYNTRFSPTASSYGRGDPCGRPLLDSIIIQKAGNHVRLFLPRRGVLCKLSHKNFPPIISEAAMMLSERRLAALLMLFIA